jgi:outer membrane biosynthesis protein TonB
VLASKADKTGWVFSASLHAGVAVLALVGLPHFDRSLPDTPPPIAIEFVKIAEKTQVVAPEAPKEQQREEVKEQPKAAPAEAVAAVPDDAAPLLEKQKPQKIEPKPTPKPKPVPKPQVSQNTQLANRVTPRSKPKPPSRFKTQQISALIDRSIKEEVKQAPKADEKKEKAMPAPKEKKLNFAEALRGRLATASLMDALRRKVEENWSFPGGAKGVEDMQVTIRIWVRPDGSFSRAPEFLQAGNLNDPDRAFYRIFAESARRAVLLSEPFDEAAQYLDSSQKYIDFIFNGAEFAGG